MVLTLVIMFIGLAASGVITFMVMRGVGGALRNIAQGQAEVQRLLQYGQQATGRVIGLGAGGATMTMGVQRSIEVCVDLEVWLAGRAPYRAQAKQMVSELRIASLQPGAQVALRVDPRDPSKVVLADVAAAAGYPLPVLGRIG